MLVVRPANLPLSTLQTTKPRTQTAHASNENSLGKLKPIGLIGVGLIGSALIDRLVSGGFEVVAYDINESRMAGLRASGAHSAVAVFASCDRVLLSLPSHHEVEFTIRECISALRPGLIIVDTTTGDPTSTLAIGQKLTGQNVIYLDTTISGSSAQVRSGTATLMIGGDEATFEKCADIFKKISGRIFYTGPVGSGAKMKLVTNLVLGLNRAALGEGLALAQSLALPLELTLEVMRGCAAYSRIMDSKGERMINGQFSPDARLSQHLKDVRLIIQAGQEAGLAMPLSTAHRAVLEQAEAAGLGELDNSAIIKVLMRGGNENGTQS